VDYAWQYVGVFLRRRDTGVGGTAPLSQNVGCNIKVPLMKERSEPRLT